VCRHDDGPLTHEALELPVEQRRAVLVQSRIGLVEHEEIGIVKQRPTQRETLRHAA